MPNSIRVDWKTVERLPSGVEMFNQWKPTAVTPNLIAIESSM